MPKGLGSSIYNRGPKKKTSQGNSHKRIKMSSMNKNRKRSFRNLWISRINAASRELGFSYSKLINLLDKKQIRLNRKILADISVNDRKAFQEIVNKASG